jgi:hypothetical protein
MFYILDENNEPKKATLQECGDWMNDPRRIVKQDNYWPWFVSTVFLGIDHRMPSASVGPDESEPVLFETMVFRAGDGGAGVKQRRYTSYEDAQAGHQDMATKYFLLRNLGVCAIGFVVVAVIMMAALTVIL